MPMSTIEKHMLGENVEEQIAIRNLAGRGRDFVVAFFKSADVSEHQLACVYHGLPIDEMVLNRIKRVLKERMPRE
jgi:hypothetical protein